MKVEFQAGSVIGLKMIRTESDKPLVARPLNYDPNKKLGNREYNSWRESYYLSFPSEEELRAAIQTIEDIGDFDKAAGWLDKQ